MLGRSNAFSKSIVKVLGWGKRRGGREVLKGEQKFHEGHKEIKNKSNTITSVQIRGRSRSGPVPLHISFRTLLLILTPIKFVGE
ncbi:Uncharacterized protein DAT39_015516 [Clarias magur]|uniref:Uncharacterized protein n=1 Tax=Clarias magur TaxID=1594786 RepID=A0A8J4TD77_CLAMG|nr:Uncharacterized protein DAT39_015516 [Clarias magur]